MWLIILQQADVCHILISCSFSFNWLRNFSFVTVNSGIFTRVLYAKFRENKSSQNVEITLSFTDIVNSCPSRGFLALQMCYLTLLAKIKLSPKFPDLQ